MLEDSKPFFNTSLRLEEELKYTSKGAIKHHNLDSFHAYIRLLIRRDVKDLKARGLIESDQ